MKITHRVLDYVHELTRELEIEVRAPRTAALMWPANAKTKPEIDPPFVGWYVDVERVLNGTPFFSWKGATILLIVPDYVLPAIESAVLDFVDGFIGVTSTAGEHETVDVEVTVYYPFPASD